MITGELSLAAVSITALIVFDPVQLAAGRANCSALARAKRSLTSAPVMTPGREVATSLGHLPDATSIAFPGHAGRAWPLLRWRLVARTR